MGHLHYIYSLTQTLPAGHLKLSHLPMPPKKDYSYHILCSVLVASDRGCVTRSSLRFLYKVIDVKGGLRLLQLRVHNKRAWTSQMSPHHQSHCWNHFHFYNPTAKLIFVSIQPCVAGRVCEPFFTSCSL